MQPSITTFDSIGRYYDLLYRDKDYAQETNYVLDLLERLKFKGRDTLEFGSGTGQHGRLLAKRGLHILGVELSPTMLARSKNVPGFTAVQGDARSFQAHRRFDLVLSLFHVASYQTSDVDIQAFFTNAANHLEMDGLFIFDCWFSPAVNSQRPETRVKRMVDESIEVVRIAESSELVAQNLVEVHYTVFVRDLASRVIQTFTELHTMRHFSIPELDRIAASAGFTRVLAEGFLSGERPDTTTWGVCFAYRKESNV